MHLQVEFAIINMRVKFISERVEIIPEELRQYSIETVVLTPGNEYVVFALCTMCSEQWYLLCDDNYNTESFDSYPRFYPASLFDITDASHSKYWIEYKEIDEYIDSKPEVTNYSFPEFAHDIYFYGELLEARDGNYSKVFNRYKLLMETEAWNGYPTATLGQKLKIAALANEGLHEIHTHCTANREEIEASSRCACFYCQEVFRATEVKDYIVEPSMDYKETALCPRCGADTILGDAAGIPFYKELIEKLHHHYFK